MAPSNSILFALCLFTYAISVIAREYIPRSYIVEFDRSAHIKRELGQVSVHQEWHAYAKRSGILYQYGHEYALPEIFIGVSVTLENDHDVRILRTLPYVKAVHPDVAISSPPSADRVLPHEAKVKRQAPDAFSPHVMTRLAELHAEGLRGKGVQACIVDTGADWSHPALGGCIGPDCKINIARNYAADQGPHDISDCHSHGTHTLGTLAANADPHGFVGAAPEAKVAVYRIFPCGAKSTGSLTIRALEDAVKDGCQVLSMSLGEFSGWDQHPVSQLATDISRKHNIVIVVSMGNEGDEGLFFGQSPAASLDAITVGSLQVAEFRGQVALLDDTHEVVYQAAVPFSDPTRAGPKFLGSTPIYRLGDQLDSAAGAACDTLDRDYSDGVVVVNVKTDSCSWKVKLANLQAGRSPNFVLVRTSGEDIEVDHPTISRKDGEYIFGRLDKGALSATFPATFRSVRDTKEGGHPGSYSSYGPSWRLMGSQAAVTAPGGNILSTMPIKMGSYGFKSGTSMSTPLVAGAAVLYLQAKNLTRESTKPMTIRDVFTNTARPVTDSVSRQVDVVSRSGAGLIDAFCAVHTNVIVSPAQFALGDETTSSTPHHITITNDGNEVVTYRIRHEAAPTVLSIDPATGKYNAPPLLRSQAAKVTLSAQTITVPAHSSRQVVATFAQPTGEDFAGAYPVYSGFLHLSSNSSCDPTVSYYGVAGKMIDYTILRNAPRLLHADGNPITPSNNTFDRSHDVPRAFVRMFAGSRFVAFDLVHPDAVIPTGVKTPISPSGKVRRDAAQPNAGRLSGGRLRRTLRPRQSAVDEQPETGDGAPGVQAGEAASASRTLSDDRLALTTAFGPVASQLRLVGAFAERDTAWAPRTPNASPTLDQVDALSWDVVDEDGVKRDIEPGSYRLLVRAVRIGGDPTTLEGYEAALSDIFVVLPD